MDLDGDLDGDDIKLEVKDEKGNIVIISNIQFIKITCGSLVTILFCKQDFYMEI